MSSELKGYIKKMNVSFYNNLNVFLYYQVSVDNTLLTGLLLLFYYAIEKIRKRKQVVMQGLFCEQAAYSTHT